jgi:hypothetical protein
MCQITSPSSLWLHALVNHTACRGLMPWPGLTKIVFFFNLHKSLIIVTGCTVACKIKKCFQCLVKQSTSESDVEVLKLDYNSRGLAALQASPMNLSASYLLQGVQFYTQHNPLYSPPLI